MDSRTDPSLASILVMSLILAGCSELDPTAPIALERADMALVTSGHGKPREVLPFRLDASAVFLSQDFAPGFGPPVFGKSLFGGRCSVTSDFVIGFGIEGHGAHLGAFTGAAEHCTQIDFQAGLSTVTDGFLSLTAADGDELWATYVGAPGPRGFEEHMTFAGGTGRFTEASGEATAHPECDQVTRTCTLRMHGVIAY